MVLEPRPVHVFEGPFSPGVPALEVVPERGWAAAGVSARTTCTISHS